MDKQKKETSKSPNPRLEIPSDAAISMRKQTMMERLLTDKKSIKTSRVEISSVLGRVKAFLPQMKTANEELSTMDAESVQVDNVPEDATSYIEMNLGLFSDSEDSDEEERVNAEESKTDYDDVLGVKGAGLKMPGEAAVKPPLVQVIEPEQGNKDV